MKSVNDWKFANKLIAAFALVIALSVVANTVIFAKVQGVQELTRKNGRTADLSIDVQTVLRGVVEQQSAARAYAMGGGADQLAAYDKYGALTDEALERFIGQTASDETAGTRQGPAGRSGGLALGPHGAAAGAGPVIPPPAPRPSSRSATSRWKRCAGRSTSSRPPRARSRTAGSPPPSRPWTSRAWC